MLKKYIIIMSVLMLAISLCACDNKETTKTSSKFEQIGKDEIVVCCDDYDLFFPSSGGITERRLRFPIIAGEDVKKEDIKVYIDDVEFEYDITEEEKDELQYYTYLSYTDVDWEKFTELYRTDSFEFGEYEKKYVEEYEKLDLGKLPKYNYFVVSISFDYDIVNKNISEVSISCNDKEHVIKGDIAFVEGKVLPDTDSSVFEDYGLAYDELTFVPTNENKYYIDIIELAPTKDVEIVDVFTVEGNQLKVNKVTAAVNGDVSIDRILKSDSPIKVSSGDKCMLNIELLDHDSNKKFTYTSNPIIIIKYKMDGKDYYANVNTIARTILDSSELYAKYVDGVNVDRYYETFYKAFQN